ncbi:pentapeptide repeat-containing protein [Pseudomonadota bacterium]
MDELDKTEYLSKSFNGLCLTSENISSKKFDSCTFKDCDFSEANLNDSKFIDCTFIKCNLSIAKIDNCKFSDVVFEECKLIGIDWISVAWPQIALCSPVKFYKCIINDCIFFGLSLEELVIEQCKAHDVDFREGNFTDSNFTYTDFSNSMFNKTNLTGVNFTEAFNYNIDIHFNEIKRAQFSRHEAIRLLDSLDIELVD